MARADLKEALIAVLMGGLSAEREVSLQSGQAMLEALNRKGYKALAIDIGEDLCHRLAASGAGVALIALHGTWGEDGCVQGLLETLRLPYSGSGVAASAMAMDKVITKRLMGWAGLPTAEWRYPATAAAVAELGLPVVVKPRREGSSVGLSVVRAEAEVAPALERAGDALVERYIPGREFAVGVLGEGPQARVLGSVEIRPAGGHYDYAAKYTRDDTQYLAPAPVPPEVEAQMARAALDLHRLLGCRGGTRADLRWDGAAAPQLLEINTIPGMTSHSLLPKVAALQGMSFDDLVEALLQGARLEN